MRGRSAEVILLIAMAGCGPSPSDRPVEDVIGKQALHYFEEASGTDVPEDLTKKVVEALVPEGDGYRALAGTGQTDGTFTIAGVPAGRVVIRVGDLYLDTTERVVDLGSVNPGQQSPAVGDGNTAASFTLTNLRAWSSSDKLRLYAFGSRTFTLASGAAFAPDILNGDVSTTSATLRLDGIPLTDASRSHVLHVAQVQNAIGYTSTERRMLRVGSVPVTLAQGATTPINLALAELPDPSVSANFRGTEFYSMVSAAHPQAVPSYYVDFYGAPAQGLDERFPYVGALLPVWQFQLQEWNIDRMLSVLPSSPLTGTTLIARVLASSSITAEYTPGATVELGVHSTSSFTAEELGAGPVRPKALPPTQIRISGRVAQAAALSGIGLSPLVEWTAPERPASSSYSVSISKLSAAGEVTHLATIFTSNTSVRIPPGILQAGENHFLYVQARDHRPDVADVAPLRLAALRSHASAISSVFTP